MWPNSAPRGFEFQADISAISYHAGMDPRERNQVQDMWINGDKDVVCDFCIKMHYTQHYVCKYRKVEALWYLY